MEIMEQLEQLALLDLEVVKLREALLQACNWLTHLNQLVQVRLLKQALPTLTTTEHLDAFRNSVIDECAHVMSDEFGMACWEREEILKLKKQVGVE